MNEKSNKYCIITIVKVVIDTNIKINITFRRLGIKNDIAFIIFIEKHRFD